MYVFKLQLTKDVRESAILSSIILSKNACKLAHKKCVFTLYYKNLRTLDNSHVSS